MTDNERLEIQAQLTKGRIKNPSASDYGESLHMLEQFRKAGHTIRITLHEPIEVEGKFTTGPVEPRKLQDALRNHNEIVQEIVMDLTTVEISDQNRDVSNYTTLVVEAFGLLRAMDQAIECAQMRWPELVKH